MKRQIEAQLNAWRLSPRRKPLILRGARQVGKTYILQAFAKDNFDTCAYVDFERNPSWHRVFEPDLNPKRICAELEVLLGVRIEPGKTLIFFDEIQACPKALMSLRYFYEKLPEVHVVAAGSLLEFLLGEIPFPVGRVQTMALRPLNFGEYLDAIGKPMLRELVSDKPRRLADAIHEELLAELRRFFFIGGMPECVRVYAETGSLVESYAVQAEICDTYRADFAKYKPATDHMLLNHVLASVVQRVGEQIKYSRLAEGFSHPTIKRAFDLLRLAKLVEKVPSVNPAGLPLGASASDKIFKSLLLDVGLMRYLSGMPTEVEFNKGDLLDIYRGAVADQFVGQELLGTQDELYCWIRSAQVKNSNAEVEYLAVIDGKIHPIEVKSGSPGRLKSIQLFMETFPDCGDGLVFSMRPYEELPDKRLRLLPLYYVQAATLSTGLV